VHYATKAFFHSLPFRCKKKCKVNDGPAILRYFA